MKINDLINSFDAMTPTEEKKEKMLSEILKAEDKKAVRIFDFKKAGMVAAGLAAAVALVVSVYNFGSFKNPDNGTYVAQVTENADKVAGEQSSALPQRDITPRTEAKKPVTDNGRQVASAKPVTEANQEAINDVPMPTPQPRASGGGAMAARSLENIQEAADNTEDNANAGIAVASEDMHNENAGIEAASGEGEPSGGEGIAVVSENDAENQIEWITVPSMEDVSPLEENTDIEGESEDEEEKDEDEEKEGNIEE